MMELSPLLPLTSGVTLAYFLLLLLFYYYKINVFSFAEMDPNYGVLFNYDGSNKCGSNQVKDNDGITGAVIGGAIGGLQHS